MGRIRSRSRNRLLLLLVMLLILTTVLQNRGSGVHAASSAVYQSYGNKIYYSGVYDRKKHILINGKWQIAYCMETTKAAPAGFGKKVSFTPKALSTSGKPAKMLYYGYGYPGFSAGIKKWAAGYKSSKELNTKAVAKGGDQAYVFTHQVIAYAYKGTGSFKFAGGKKLNKTWQNAVKSAYAFIGKLPAPPYNTAVSFKKVSGSYTLLSLKKGWKSPVYEFTAKAAGDTVSFKVPSGFSLYSTTEKKTYAAGKTVKMKSGSRFYVLTPYSAAKKTFTTGTVKSSYKNYKPYYFDAPNRGSKACQDIGFCGEGETSQTKLSLTFPAPKRNRLVLLKKKSDSQGKVSAETGAKFRIWPEEYGKSGYAQTPAAYRQELTVKSDGKTAASKLLPVFGNGLSGRYYVIQTAGSKSVYWLTQKLITLTYNSGKTLQINLGVDKAKPLGIRIVKVDAESADGAAVIRKKGTTFRIKVLSTGQWLSVGGKTSFVTGTDGTVGISPVPAGKYALYETKAPAGYQLDENPVPFEVKEGATTTLEVRFSDYRKPDLETAAWDKRTKESQGVSRNEDSGDRKTFVDTVSYIHLDPYTEYTIRGTLMVRESGEPLKDEDGNAVTAETVLKAGEHGEQGSVEMAFPVDSEKMKGQSVVAFEALYHDQQKIASHEDLENRDQTVFYPDIATDAADKDTETHTGQLSEKETIIDRVNYSNLIPGKEYTVEGKLMDKSSGEPLTDAGGNEITSEKTFKPEAADGTVEMEFTADSTLLNGKTIVVFEELKTLNQTVAAHADLSDEAQTICYPEVSTTAADPETGTQKAEPGKKTEIVDTIRYRNLTSGEEYTVEGTMMDQETGEAVTAGGETVTASTTFTAGSADGEVEVRFVFDSEALAGKKVVAFEQLKQNGKTVAKHEDINSIEQCIEILVKKSATEKSVPKKNITEEVKKKKTPVTPQKTKKTTPGKVKKTKKKTTKQPKTSKARKTPKRSVRQVRVRVRTPGTGDRTSLGKWLLTAGAAICLMLALLRVRRSIRQNKQ